MSVLNLAKSYDFFKPEFCRERIHIIGCGSVGSTLAELLARFGLTNFALYDFDTVEPHNLANQMFRIEHIGMPKVDALALIHLCLKVRPAHIIIRSANKLYPLLPTCSVVCPIPQVQVYQKNEQRRHSGFIYLLCLVQERDGHNHAKCATSWGLKLASVRVH